VISAAGLRTFERLLYRLSMSGGSWPVSDRRVRSPTGSGLYTSVCSAISKASSTSMPRYACPRTGATGL